MAIRLHHNPGSQHARRAHIALIELGLDFEIVSVDFAKGDNQSETYLAHNPNGKVPTLEDGDFWLWESNAIMAYLADKVSGQRLYPTDARARAEVNRWLFWESAHFGNACVTLTWERVVKPFFMKQDPNPALVEHGEANLRRFGAVLDRQLAGKEYVVGSLSIADFALGSILMYREPAKMDLEAFPNIKRWIALLESRESFKKTAPR